MAAANQLPIPDPVAGAAALAEDLPRVLSLLDAAALDQLGWRQPNKLTLLVPMHGVHQGVRTDFLLKLGFQAYREWPPSAQFVNPETLRYESPSDNRFVPQLTSEQCRTHTAYPRPNNSGTLQLVCCSATLEFYEVLHSVAPEHVWRSSNSFFTTITAINAAFTSSYQGPF